MSEQSPQQANTAPSPVTSVPSHLAESSIRIQELHDTEEKLVLLVETVGEALAVLSDDAPNVEDTDQLVRERVLKFRQLAAEYFTLINDIQLSLRSNVQYLRKAGALTQGSSKSIPFRPSIADKQEELEIWLTAAKNIRENVEKIKAIAQE